MFVPFSLAEPYPTLPSFAAGVQSDDVPPEGADVDRFPPFELRGKQTFRSRKRRSHSSRSPSLISAFEKVKKTDVDREELLLFFGCLELEEQK